MGKYSKPAKLKGWDFSQVRVVEEGPRIDYSKVVESRLGKTKILLDIGTGGGKKFLVLASKVRRP